MAKKTKKATKHLDETLKVCPFCGQLGPGPICKYCEDHGTGRMVMRDA